MIDYPDTPEKRRAGMAAFRAQMLAAHQRVLADGHCAKADGTKRKLTKRERADVQSYADSIKAAQVRHGEE